MKFINIANSSSTIIISLIYLLSTCDIPFNIFELLGATIFKCCQSKELKIKYTLNEKANLILFSKLDINLFVRNMIILDILNETLIGPSLKHIINFLSSPIITLKGDAKNELALFYQRYKSSDFKKFSDEISELVQISGKKKEEKDLISLANKHLKQLQLWYKVIIFKVKNIINNIVFKN